MGVKISFWRVRVLNRVRFVELFIAIPFEVHRRGYLRVIVPNLCHAAKCKGLKPKINETGIVLFMGRQLFLSILLLIVFLFTAGPAFCDISIGVKRGDWIEYNVVFTGTPPSGHEVTWARSEVVDVQGKVLRLNITTEFSDGTFLNESITLNLETGQLGDDFIIPANLNEGDTFSDNFHGIVEITAVEERSYVGATRTVVSANATGSIYYWDKITGVLVEGISEFPDYSIHSIADNTNMWEPQTSGLQPAILYLLLTVGAVIIVSAAVLFARRRKK